MGLSRMAVAARRHRDTALEQDGPQLVDQCRPLADEAISCPVQRLHVELLLALELDKAHRRPRRSLGDRLRITSSFFWAFT
jgi:hypothetical protein